MPCGHKGRGADARLGFPVRFIELCDGGGSLAALTFLQTSVRSPSLALWYHLQLTSSFCNQLHAVVNHQDPHECVFGLFHFLTT